MFASSLYAISPTAMRHLTIRVLKNIRPVRRVSQENGAIAGIIIANVKPTPMLWIAAVGFLVIG